MREAFEWFAIGVAAAGLGMSIFALLVPNIELFVAALIMMVMGFAVSLLMEVLP